jgi:Flp pilus assembly pilin Flp
MTTLALLFRKLLRDRTAGPAVEYALVTALFGLACIIGFNAVSVGANAAYSQNTNGMMRIQESPLPTQVP